MPKDAKALVLAILEETWNKKTPALIEELYGTNCIIHTPDGALHGIEGAKQLYAAYTTSFPDVHFTIEDIIAEDDRVAVRYIFHGTHRGALRGIPPTGKHVTVVGSVFFRFADGKLIEQRGLWDSLSFMQQLGVVST
jgi:steroid delta-isomerase-like uncharacterized protein